MKAFKFIIWGILIFLGIFYILPSSLLQVPYIQKEISSVASNYLEEKLETEVSIERIEFELFNKLILKNVYLEDLSGDTLFVAKRIAAGFDFLPLFKKQFHFSSAQLFTFSFYLNKESDDAPLNIQYIIDAFKKDEKKEKSSIDLQIQNLNLRLGNFHYRVKDASQTPGKFNAKDIALSNISCKINLHELTEDSISATISRLNFTDKSHFRVKQLALDLQANKEHAQIESLHLDLVKSKLHISDIFVDFSDRLEDTRFQIQPSLIYLNELSPIIPVFSHYRDKVSLQGTFFGNLDKFSATDLQISCDEKFEIYANAQIQNLTSSHSDKIFINGDIRNSFVNAPNIVDLIQNFSGEHRSLPSPIERLGKIYFSGRVNGYLDNLQAFGDFSTDIGDLHTDINIGRNTHHFIRGEISSSELDLQKLLDNDNFGKMVFSVTLNSIINTPNKRISGKINADVKTFEYKSYTYENIHFNGNFTPKSFDGSLDISSPDGQLLGNGLVVIDGKKSKFDFSAQATNLLLDKLNLTQKYENPELSFSIDANFEGNEADNMLGNIRLNDVIFSTDEGNYTLNDLTIDSKENTEEKRIVISSDLISGEIHGIYHWKNLIANLKQTFAKSLPGLLNSNKDQNKKVAQQRNDIQFQFQLNDTRQLSSTLKLPVTLCNQTTISGSYFSENHSLDLEIAIPQLISGGTNIESANVLLKNRGNRAELNVRGENLKKENKIPFSGTFIAENDSIYSSIHIDSNDERGIKGNINLAAHLISSRGKNPIAAFIDFQESQLIINQSPWILLPAHITYESGKISVSEFTAQSKDQFVKIDGNVSTNPEDEIKVKLNKVDLKYLFETLNIPALQFSGIASGYVSAQDVYNTRQLNTNLSVDNFGFNKTTFGDLELIGTWNNEKQQIEMAGNIDGDSTSVIVSGHIQPIKEELDIAFDAVNVNAEFLRRYLDKVVQNLSGKLSGKLSLVGDLNNPTVEGNVFVENGGFDVDFLNTRYQFTDSVRCTRTQMAIKNATFFDKEGNKGLVSGYVNHHQFSDFEFSADIKYNNFLIFNATKKKSPAFYGTAYATGTAEIKGTEKIVDIKVNAENESNTHITLNFMEEMDVVEYNFINFVNKTQKIPVDSISNENNTLAISTPFYPNLDNGTEIVFELQLNANPEATLDLIMDPVSGDKISGYGHGNLNIQYGTSTPLKVVGAYTIDEGKYNFSLQQVLYRDFKIRQGSTITFNGDPYLAALDIIASYRVAANLGDLDQQLLQLSARSTVDVDCLLGLTGPLSHPEVSFDLELPTSTTELQRQVKSYIHTDDMMNRQIVYLLILSRFYTSPEYAVDSEYGSDLAFLTSTLSTQISNLLGQISDNFQVGTRFHQSHEGSESNTEVEVLLSSTLLNNRLIINGNFGYIDNPYLNNNENNGDLPLVGDFDVEYKLTKSGDIRLKGFNHYNYRNYFSLTPEMTQGIGILFRRDFNNLHDLLFGRKKEEKEPETKKESD